jgi:putative ABC transport system permease protein
MDTAKKYFGNENPIGKTIRVDNLHDFTVKGVLRNVPGNTHFRFDFLVSFITVNSFDWPEETGPNTWSSLDFFTYIKLQKNSNPLELEKKLTAFERKYQGENGSNKFLLQPITNIHLHSHLNKELEDNSDIRYVYIFSAIALLIMSIAAFNYTNLSTARSAARAKEVGMRKVVGAEKKDLIKQFLSESMLFSLLSLLLSLFLVELFLPLFNSLIEKKLELGFTLFNDWKVLLFLAVFFVLTGLISGFYPSLFLSSIHPIKILKGTFMLDLKDPTGFRNPLVVFQFIISIVLVTCTIVINNQLNYIKSKEPGYDKNHIVIVPVYDLNLRNNYENLKSELIQNPQILDITASRELPSNIRLGGFGTSWEGKSEEKKLIVYRAFVNYNFIDFYGMELVKGRNFSSEFSSDKNKAFILNETAVKSFGWEDPIGKSIGCFDQTGKRFNEGVVIGVIKDFHFLPLHRKIKPLWLRVSTTQNNYLSIKISSKDIKATLAFLEKKFREFSPDYPFEYSFLDDSINKMYNKEQRLGEIFNCFTFIAIFIASLGVLGLSSFIAEKKTKEIGIRKVLGASVRNIFYMLSKRFFKLVILSSIMALPIAWFAMTKWLSNFAYKVNIGIGTFFTAVAMVLIITFLTISYQAIKAAKANPVDLLRYE